ncbi:hypothetical protein ATN84_06530 [Paramesorhizobium deserti]|uniref:UPF0235 protein ATN84_06530 n=1 Tax=Paramesorhizobium deserti TaxID=1494590 RepID=A0A135I1Q1_9HYPH|nr:DUF167 family protein [Paramesorhizobium deserti]KXF79361.1 hypothetical protein ATN84_06530 [Paramesorhizobium deserti]
MGPNVKGFCRIDADGITVFVRLTPKSSRDAVEGIADAADGRRHLIARVRAVPEDGKANKALEKLIAKTLRVAGGGVSVTGGATSRLKQVHIMGEPQALAARLRAVLSSAEDAT